MRGRLRDLGVGSAQAVTFHAAGLRQLRYFWPQLVGDTRWELIDSKFTLVAQAANRVKVSTTTDTVRDLAGEIEWAKASLISPETYPAAAAKFGRDAPVPPNRWPRSTRATKTQGPARWVHPSRLRRPAASYRGRHRKLGSRRRGVPGPLSLFRRRRVPGRDPAAAAGARRVAGAAR